MTVNSEVEHSDVMNLAFYKLNRGAKTQTKHFQDTKVTRNYSYESFKI